MIRRILPPSWPPGIHAWWLTFILLAVAELIIRQFKAPLHEFHPAAYTLSLLTSFLLWLLIGRIFYHLPGQFSRRIAAVLTGFLVTILLFSSYFTYAEFGEFISDDMLSFVLADPLYFRDFTYDLLFNWTLLPFTLVTTGLTFLWLRSADNYSTLASPSRHQTALSITLAATVAFGGSLGGMFAFSSNTQKRLETAFLVSVPRVVVNTITDKETLRLANRQKVEPIASPTDYNVLIVLNESWGRQFLGFYPSENSDENSLPGMPFLESWLKEHEQEVFIFEQFFSDSGATNVSVPSLMTGVAPYEPNEKLHSLPLPWQWARANNMHSVLVTPQRYSWANFNSFFFSDPPHQYASAETIPSPIVNDTGVDDMVAANVFRQLVQQAPAEQPLLAIYGTNATHGPYQQTSALLPDLESRPTRYAQALLISDSAIQHVFQTLQDAGRLDNTIIFITADHGVVETPAHLPRLYSFYDEIMRIPFIIRLPPTLLQTRPELAKIMRENQPKLASNIDLIPTLVDLLNLTQSEHNTQIVAQLKGRSLAKPLHTDHTVIALNTNDVRSWKNEGFGIYQHNLRFVFSDIEGPRLFNTILDPDQQDDLWPRTDPQTRNAFLEHIQNNKHANRIYQAHTHD